MYKFIYTAPDGKEIEITLPENDPERAGQRGLAYWRANKQYNPAGQESFGSDVLLGAQKEAIGSYRGLKQLFDKNPYTFTPRGDGSFSRTSSENQRLIDESKRFDEKYIDDRLGVAVGEVLPWMAAGFGAPGMVGRIAKAPALAQKLGESARVAAGIGAMEGITDPIAGEHSMADKGANMLTSAALAGSGAVGSKVIGSLFAPALNRARIREHAALMGEMLDSNTIRTGEIFAKNVPAGGRYLQSFYDKGLEKFNRRVYSDIAERAGVSIDDIEDVGNDAVGVLSQRMGRRFDEIVEDYVPQKKGKIEFTRDSMQRLDDRIVSGLTKKQARPVREAINDVLASISKFDDFDLQTTNMRLRLSGPDYRKLDIALRKRADKLPEDQADIKQAIFEMRKALLDELPDELKTELGPLKDAYVDLIKLSEAAGGEALENRGIVTPKQLLGRYKGPLAGRGKSPAIVKMLQDANEAMPEYRANPNMLSANAAAQEVGKLRGMLTILPAAVVNTPGIRQMVRKMAERDPNGWGKQFRGFMRKYGVGTSPGAATLDDPEGGPPPVAPKKNNGLLKEISEGLSFF